LNLIILTFLFKIDPKRAIPRQEHQRATKLFIGGLAGSVTSESMREFFSQFGKVIDSTVMLDRETGRSKGFGFVSFEDTNVQPFLGFGNLEIDGKLVRYIYLTFQRTAVKYHLSLLYFRLTSNWLNLDTSATTSLMKRPLPLPQVAILPKQGEPPVPASAGPNNSNKASPLEESAIWLLGRATHPLTRRR